MESGRTRSLRWEPANYNSANHDGAREDRDADDHRRGIHATKVSWFIRLYNRQINSTLGRLPPFTPHGKAEWEKRVKAEKDGSPIADASAYCWPHGVPRVMNSPYPIQVIQTTLDAAGLPHSTEMRVTEQIRKLDADTLEDRITIDDPKTYTRPWTSRVTYRRQPGLRLKEYVCTDSNPEAQHKGS